LASPPLRGGQVVRGFRLAMSSGHGETKPLPPLTHCQGQSITHFGGRWWIYDSQPEILRQSNELLKGY